MSRFARLGEDAFARQKELTGEEFRLYAIIVFHTWFESGFCNKNLQELSAIHSLIYNHTTERYKKLRIKNWCENTKKGIRPLVGIKTPKFGVLEEEKLQKSEFPKWLKLQNSELETPKNGVIEAEKLQISELYIRKVEPLKTEIFQDTATAEKNAAAAVETNGHLSRFSIEECLRYAQICVNRGEPIANPHGLATHAYKTGSYDVFISATLYPEQTEAIQVPTCDAGDADTPKPLSEAQRREAFNLLYELFVDGSSVNDFERFYTPGDWQWLKGELDDNV